MGAVLTRTSKVLLGAASVLLAMSLSAEAGERGAKQTANDDWSYDYNVPLSLPPHGYTPGFWGYGGKRHYDKFGNYRKYQEPRRGPYDGPVESRPLPGSVR